MLTSNMLQFYMEYPILHMWIEQAIRRDSIAKER
jgi:hypothetical protein